MKALFDLLLLLGAPAGAFAGGWLLTERFFELKLVPLPFEPTGIAVGSGCALWTLAVLVLFVFKRQQGGKS